MEQVLAILAVVALLFWIGKFYVDAARLLFRLVRWACLRLVTPPAVGGQATPQAGGWPPFRP